MNRFPGSTEAIPKDIFHCFLTKLDENRVMWKKRIFSYFQIIYSIIKTVSASQKIKRGKAMCCDLGENSQIN